MALDLLQINRMAAKWVYGYLFSQRKSVLLRSCEVCGNLLVDNCEYHGEKMALCQSCQKDIGARCAATAT